jgi:ligand-binding sensor domain-containing protein
VGRGVAQEPVWDVSSLTALSGNLLWVGLRRDGIALLRDGKIIQEYRAAQGLPRSAVYSVRQDPQGRTWAATSAGVYLLEGGHWKRNWPAEGQQPLPTANLLVDHAGTLCFTTDAAIYCKRALESGFSLQFPGAPEDLAVSDQGSFWIWPLADGVRPMQSESPPPYPLITGVKSGHMIIDRKGSVWVVGYGEGLLRFIPESKGHQAYSKERWLSDSYSQKDGLGSNFALAIFEDREGNMWVGSPVGLDRFRDSKMVSVPVIANGSHTVIAPAANGLMWAGFRSSPLLQISADDRVTTIRDAPSGVTCAFVDSNDSVWFGSSPSIWQWTSNHFEHFRLPDVVQGSSDVQAITRSPTGIYGPRS